jgi:large conductance mechanosensitive channel
MLKEFREFALKGNVMDLAIGVIIGAAFTKLVTAVVDDLINPIIGFATPGGLDFSNIYVMLRGTAPAGTSLVDARKIGPAFAVGDFVSVVINFLILAFILFLMVKGMNRLRRQAPPADAVPPAPPEDVKLLTEIRDLLATRR